MKLLSANNTKLSKDGIRSFGLPAGFSCPGAGECAKFCFAKSGCYRFPVVADSRRRNMVISEGGDFVKLMNAELKRTRKQYIRIHDSGDFYSQAYLDKWVSIIRANPEKTFYCYSTSLHLDWTAFDNTQNCYRAQSAATKHKDKIIATVSVATVNDTGSECDDSDLIALHNMMNSLPIYLKKR